MMTTMEDFDKELIRWIPFSFSTILSEYLYILYKNEAKKTILSLYVLFT